VKTAHYFEHRHLQHENVARVEYRARVPGGLLGQLQLLEVVPTAEDLRVC